MSSNSSRWMWTAAAAVTATVAVGGWAGWKKSEQQRRRETTATTSRAPRTAKTRETTVVQEEKKDPEQLNSDLRPMAEVSIGSCCNNEQKDENSQDDKLRILSKGVITIAHGSVTGNCAKFAQRLEQTLKESFLQSQPDHPYRIQVGTMEEWDWWDELLNEDDDDSNDQNGNLLLPKLILMLPTYTNGTWTPVSSPLLSTLEDLQNDWRIEKFPLKRKLQVGIFGMGSSAYGDDTMGRPAREAQRHLQKLGAKTIVRLSIGDDSIGNHAETSFDQWASAVVSQIQKFDQQQGTSKKQQQKLSAKAGTSASSSSCDKGSECCQNETSTNDPVNGEQSTERYYDDDDSDNDGDRENNNKSDIVDVEDMGDAILASKNSVDLSSPPEMVTPSQAEALKKEGYKLIGTHSAVKLCRWTKHQLRGRGGCYKHTFYGITSYQCMEATPSLACANKCVFCWRHHKNPVGKEWRWKTDDPYFIVDQAVKTHVNMIKEAKGIPGVQMDRWKEAHTVRHCALSLVGEPIMYPRIDELLGDLHSRKISTFLVTNGQHPQAIESLRPITQLYVSVDAPTRDSLIAIDRPLFQDAWERLKQSLASLKDKGQRTVARLTVVKGWNSDEIAGYAELIALGHVSLVEVKGVTFCGKSDASNLNMTNTPWHHEVVALTTTLKKELDKLRKKQGNGSTLPEYGLACEHKHSCSVLLARVDQFAIDDPVTGTRKWRTWIDYDKFHVLAARFAEDSSLAFSVEDYVADTPSWALFGADEEGFDPTDQRHRKDKKHPKYLQFDDRGIPTHDHNNQALSAEERRRLSRIMEERMKHIGSGSTVTELKDGAKEIADASLMFRGMVVAK